MRHSDMKVSLFIIVLVSLGMLGCTHVFQKKPERPTINAGGDRPLAGAASAESTNQVRLDSHLSGWNERIISRMQALSFEIGTIDRSLGVPHTPEEMQSLTERKQLLLKYQHTLRGISDLQQSLRQKNSAGLRESAYVDLVTQYLSCLEVERELREKVALETGNADVGEEVKRAFQNEDFQAIIDRYNQIVNGMPAADPDGEIMLYYALALIRLGRAAEALPAAEKVAQSQPAVGCGTAPLMYELGELLIDQERYDAAQVVFQSLVNFYQAENEWYTKAQKKTALLRSNLDTVRVRSKLDEAIALFEKKENFAQPYQLCQEALTACPDRSCQRDVQSVLEKYVLKAAGDLDQKMRQFDTLMQENKILEARQLLFSLEAWLSGDSYPPLLMERLAMMQQRKQLLNQEEFKEIGDLERQQYEQAVKLVESEKYDEAIPLLDQLAGGDYAGEAEQKKRFAVDEVARMRRTQAGHLFLQAKQAQNPDVKKGYLIESYNLLRDVLQQYPENQYAEKIKRNLDDVRSELQRLYPDLLPNEHPELAPDETMLNN